MRIMGHNWLAIIAAAIAIYLIEYVIFGMMMTGEQYMAMTGLTPESVDYGLARMPVGAVMPILAAIGLSMAIKWRDKPGWIGGVTTALLVAILFVFPTSLYSYVYGGHSEQFVAINLAHFLVCYAVAGAILGAWK